MKISVVTAGYNYAKYITNTIKSVLNQTYEDWEMIIVDDGSTDDSLEIIKSFIQKDSRIKLFTHENNQNKGLTETIKLGIEKAQGEWIVFLESDDSIMPKYMEEKIKIIEKYKDVDFVFNNVSMFGHDHKSVIDMKKYVNNLLSNFENLKYPSSLPDFVSIFEYLTLSLLMVKKESLKNINYSGNNRQAISKNVWNQLYDKNFAGFYINKRLSNWRIHKK